MTYLLFDFDGPIVDLFDVKSGLQASRSIVNVARRFGIYDTHGMQSALFIRVWADRRRVIARAGRDVAEFDRQVHMALEKLELRLLRSAKLDPHAATMLAVAHQHADAVAIVSNNSSEAIVGWLSQHGLARCVDLVSAREERDAFQRLKPSPALVVKAIAKLGTQPSEALFFGDTQSDFVSSRSARVKFIGLRTRHSSNRGVSVLPSSIWSLGSRAAVSHYIQANFARQDGLRNSGPTEHTLA